jgi:alginate O-acetyltransferase complex protein AlgI
MLFNSFQFLTWFLPITVGVFFFVARYSRGWAAAWLGFASVVFYSSWNFPDVYLLLISIVANYIAGYWIVKLPERSSKILLWLSVIGNLLTLGYFKYTNFFLDNVMAVLGRDNQMAKVALPLGISFFIFTQIAYVVDCYKGKVKEFNFSHYLLFITFFPQLVAGPILHHKETIPQFYKPQMYRWSSRNLVNGSLMFLFGLIKKVIFADGVVGYVAPVFDTAKNGGTLTVGDAWIGALAYTVQLYFDFSGYSDMAIGLSLIFGIKIPINFNSPYKATNIIQFWRRWHMTLSNFLRDYLYIPLGGNRKGEFRRYVNLFITMLLGGLWHGAGWTFVLWGALHGSYLVINNIWQWFRTRILWQNAERTPNWLEKLGSQAITFLAVVVAWVIFRADSIGTATTVLRTMFGRAATGQELQFSAIDNPAEAMAWVGVLLAIAWFAPNSQQMLVRFKNKIDRIQLGESTRMATTKLSQQTKLTIKEMPTWAQNYRNWHYFLSGFMLPAILLLVAISESQKVKEFIYFNF